MSRQMETLRERLGSAMRIADELSGSPVSGQPVTEQYIKTMLKLRRDRERFFGNDLFADPAWDILLELYAAALGQYRVSVTSLCVAAAVPGTTGLRWIKNLEDSGLIVRKADPMDGRRHFLMLSERALGTMNAYFRTVPTNASLT